MFVFGMSAMLVNESHFPLGKASTVLVRAVEKKKMFMACLSCYGHETGLCMCVYCVALGVTMFVSFHKMIFR